MLDFLAIVIMLATAYVGFREGLFTTACMFFNVILAGIAAFNFFEPAADGLEGLLRETFLVGYEDFFCILGIFALCLVLLRVATNNLANHVLDYPPYPQQFGGAGVGVLAGYCTAGIFLCSLQTMPWDVNFLGFMPREKTESSLRGVFPPDRAWLSMMRYAGAHGLAWKEDRPQGETRFDRFRTFDRDASFEVRYLRYRRHMQNRPPMKYQGELDELIDRKK